MSTLIQNGIPIFTDIDGDPLEDGYIYIGQPGLNPLSNPLQAYWDAALTIPTGNDPTARTKGGAAAYNGVPSRLYVPTNYSITIKDKKGQIVYTVLDANDYTTPVVYVDSVSALGTLTGTKDGQAVKVKGYYAETPLDMPDYHVKSNSVKVPNGGSVIARPEGGNFEWPETSEVNILQFGVKNDGITEVATNLQNAVDYLLELAELNQNVVANNNYSTALKLIIPRGKYLLTTPVAIVKDYTKQRPDFDIVSEGAIFIGDGTGIAFKFDGGGAKNEISNVYFDNYTKAIEWTSANANESYVKLKKCKFTNISDAAIDTLSYAASRSTLMILEECFFSEFTKVAVRSYTDHLHMKDCWVYAHRDFGDANIYLSGDGMVNIEGCFFIPQPASTVPKENARFIDFISDTTNSTLADRSIKTLTVKNCRASIEGSRGFIWTNDNSGVRPRGDANQVSSITIEDSYIACVAGLPIVIYKEGYPGSVNLKNVKINYSAKLIGVDAGNTLPPVVATYDGEKLPSHVISVDEATRLSQGFSLNVLIDPLLEPFYFDTTSQTSKYQTSIPGRLDYRVAAVEVDSNTVKASIPFNFSSSTITSENPLTFMLVTIGDADGEGITPVYGSSATTIISVVGGNSGGLTRYQLTTTTIHDAPGGISYAVSSAPISVHWGQGDTGLQRIDPASTDGTEDWITFTWASKQPGASWAYIIPLSGVRLNQYDLRQGGSW